VPEATLADAHSENEAIQSREAWVLATLPRAVAFANSLLRNRAQSEDVVHDCYVKLLAKADVYDLARDGTRILHKAIANACIDRNYRDRRVLSLERETEEDPDDRITIADERTPSPLESAARHELQAALTQALETLTAMQRGAVELKSLGYSLEEIGEALGVSPNHAGVLVHRARKTLSDRLSRFLGDQSHEQA
jgi:RNA polymerase sigma-70 factor (ECF subfamily)